MVAHKNKKDILINNDIVDTLIKGCKTQEDLFGENGGR